MDVLQSIFVFLFSVVVVIAGSISIPIIIASMMNHRRKMMELDMQAKSRISFDTQKALDEVRMEMKMLRDSSTKYNISLDNSLQRVNDTIIRLEARLTKLEQDYRVQDNRNRQN